MLCPVCSSTTCSVLICISLSLWLLSVCKSCDHKATVTIPKQSTILHALEHIWYSKVRHTWCAPPACLKEGLKTQSLLMTYDFISTYLKYFRLLKDKKCSDSPFLVRSVSVSDLLAAILQPELFVFSISSVISVSVVSSVLVSLIFYIWEKQHWWLCFFYSQKLIFFITIFVLFSS